MERENKTKRLTFILEPDDENINISQPASKKYRLVVIEWMETRHRQIEPDIEPDIDLSRAAQGFEQIMDAIIKTLRKFTQFGNSNEITLEFFMPDNLLLEQHYLDCEPNNPFFKPPDRWTWGVEREPAEGGRIIERETKIGEKFPLKLRLIDRVFGKVPNSFANWKMRCQAMNTFFNSAQGQGRSPNEFHRILAEPLEDQGDDLLFYWINEGFPIILFPQRIDKDTPCKEIADTVIKSFNSEMPLNIQEKLFSYRKGEFRDKIPITLIYDDWHHLPSYLNDRINALINTRSGGTQ